MPKKFPPTCTRPLPQCSIRWRNKSSSTRRSTLHGSVTATTPEKSVIEVEEALGERLPRIIRTHEVAAKPMSVDDAAIQIGASVGDFLVFRNADTDRLNVVYKRKDGNIGWIEPEA
ncbi:MAG: hypothetical protein DMG19_15130 [Acidobacteria bacterium]|nr:MAG: hypothetical protein DMG19_15130 [Acidobacteriota bacterium]